MNLNVLVGKTRGWDAVFCQNAQWGSIQTRARKSIVKFCSWTIEIQNENIDSDPLSSLFRGVT